MKFNIFKRSADNQPQEEQNTTLLAQNSIFNTVATNYMKLAAANRCVSVLCDSISSLPLLTYEKDSDGCYKQKTDHPVYSLLTRTPNQGRTTAQMFTYLLVRSMICNGAGYAYIERSGKSVKALHFIPFGDVQVVKPKTQFEPVFYKVKNIDRVLEASDLIVLLNHTTDGITGVSTISYAANATALAARQEQYANSFFGSPSSARSILKIAQGTRQKQKEEIRR